MSHYIRLSVDTNLGKALVLISDTSDFSNVLTSYSYDNGSVTVSPLLLVASLTTADYLDIMNELREWQEDIATRFRPTLWPRQKYFRRIKRRTSKVKIDYDIGTTVITDAEWDSATQQIIFQPRPTFTVPYADFYCWLDLLHDTANEILHFNG